MQINGLLLEGSPQALDEDVVEIAAPTIQRDFDVGLGPYSLSLACHILR